MGHGTGVIIPKDCLDMENPGFDVSYGDYLLMSDRRVTISPAVLPAYRLKDVNTQLCWPTALGAEDDASGNSGTLGINVPYSGPGRNISRYAVFRMDSD
jgi:hypothetical protein